MLRDPHLRYADRFELLQSQDLVARVFEDLHSRKIGADKTNEILAHISQAKSYFIAATDSDELVRPLLQYYGVVASTRAFLLLKSPGLREAALATGHGLSAVGWKDHLAKGGSWLDARLRVDSGTFAQLAEVTGNVRRIDIPQSGGADAEIEVAGASTFPPSYEFLVRDIVGRLPDLLALFEAITETPALAWWCSMRELGAYLAVEVTANTRGLPTEAQAREWFGLNSNTVVEATTANYAGWGPTEQLRFSLESDPTTLLPHLQNLVMRSASQYLIVPFSQGVVLSPISLFFAIAYALGMLVRYYPTHWMSLLGRRSGDSVLPLIRNLSNSVQGFAALVTDSL